MGGRQDKGKDVRVKASKMGILPRDVKDQGMENSSQSPGDTGLGRPWSDVMQPLLCFVLM